MDQLDRAQIAYDRQEPPVQLDDDEAIMDDIIDALIFSVFQAPDSTARLEKLAYALMLENVTADKIMEWIK